MLVNPNGEIKQILMIIQLELNLKIKVIFTGIQIFLKNNTTH